MKNYINKPLSTSKNNLFKTKSLSPYGHREIICKNKNIEILENLLDTNKKGHEPGSDKYINFSKNYFIRIGDMSDNNFTIAEDKKTLKIKPPLVTKSILTKGDICYQTASNVGNVCFYDGEDAYYNSHIRKLSFLGNKFYIFTMLKSSFCRNQVDIGGSIKGVDNFSESYLLNTFIPFPTTIHNDYPKDIENLVSLLTQDIISKEKQIKYKSKFIDDRIEKELRENQKSKNIKYSYPKISELKKEKRLDTGLYEKRYKTNSYIIENYTNGSFKIPVEKLKSGSTPPVRIFNGLKFDYKWVTPTDIDDNGFYKPIKKISMPTAYNLNQDAILFINRTSKGKKGEYVGISCFYDYEYYGKGQHNQGIYRIEDFTKIKKLFIIAFMNSNIMREICGLASIGSKMKEMKSYDFAKLNFPNFSEENQKKISEYYYKKVSKLKDITLDNYLEENQKRNQKLGVFQLNVEIFELKEKLNDLVDRIIMNETINISNYLSDNKS